MRKTSLLLLVCLLVSNPLLNAFAEEEQGPGPFSRYMTKFMEMSQKSFNLEELYSTGQQALKYVISRVNGVEKERKKDSRPGEVEETEVDEVLVSFVNESPFRASIFWDEDEEMTRVVDSIGPQETVKLNTFIGHTFIFTREGTRDMLGDPVAIEQGVKVYTLPADAKPADDKCADRYRKKCPKFAAAGECEKNPGWMIVNCPKACESCELLDFKARCDPKRLNISADHVWVPGDLNKMFERVVRDFSETMEIKILGQPPDLPWVLQFDRFLEDEEVEALLSWGNKLGFDRSTDTGEINERGERTKIYSTSRTSSNTWCTGECEKDPVVKRISDKIVNITRVPYNNYEQFQMLEYQIGQEYKTHHDMSPRELPEYAGGVRILTFFLYLSDVEEGGETDFPKIDLSVTPKKGRAILWPSVLDDSPLSQEPKTFHAALPVIKGKKYAANHWIHSHDFKTANLWGCTGIFD